jgi:hypothetical protein
LLASNNAVAFAIIWLGIYTNLRVGLI